ncbi:hypothetical protein OJ252_3221 [Cryptosporidium canis]|uniref:Uncharacterized protein n=1 Tax=Cryptosporidium canis TaxID=195482 RepID=A0ABQ8P303_9CRYT|nr:hypothetical protein OJ252_3221 [Cryptosporidium canis]
METSEVTTATESTPSPRNTTTNPLSPCESPNPEAAPKTTPNTTNSDSFSEINCSSNPYPDPEVQYSADQSSWTPSRPLSLSVCSDMTRTEVPSGETVECIALCDLHDQGTPVGMLLNEAQDRVLVVCNDQLYFFDLAEVSRLGSLFSGEHVPRIPYYSHMQLGGNARSICGNKAASNPTAPAGLSLFALNCRNYPIKVHSFDGELKTSVLLRNDFHEIDEIYSVDLLHSHHTSILLGGGKNRIHVYDLHLGESLDCILSSRESITSNPKRQKGIISCLSLKTSGIGSFSVFLSGSFSKSIFLHDLNDYSCQIQLLDEKVKLGGVTELYWLDGSQDHQPIDYHVISGHRDCDSIYIWDVRKPNRILLELQRENLGSNQRFNMSLGYNEDGLKLTYGDSKGNLNIQKLKFNYQEDRLQDMKTGQKVQLESHSIPFVEWFHREGLILTLSGERFTDLGEDQRCAFKVWRPGKDGH